MNLRFRSAKLVKDYRALTVAAGLGLLFLAGCRHDSVVPVPLTDYYPVAVGTYRTYAVADSTWKSRVVTVSNYQFRERVTEQYADAAGQPTYRLVRSKRANAAAAWVDDSVLVVQVLPQAVVQTASNLRTVELIYPPKANKGWNKNAFNASPDTITNLSRYYTSNVGASYTTAPAGGQAAKTYPTTVATYDILSATDNDGRLRQGGYQQVYALGVGRIVRRRYSYYTNITNSDGSQTITPGIIQMGASRRETLIETGTI
ncbi:hypothetical protein E4631_15860 [Hymenobacter sp. UV11]|uniref:hypothetical protein n=1 Tax=Hymenobacter sp. UV11 TaxID=1849735 RepID=UPI00105CADA9|nr:hypothetical protein [Hymenobacter sp. UV11]TDN39232.1 hypothetical protein A8B98_18380 [Hymenobacter sp. UV11]TFZ65691.1 hypothetical protein E4631_15860 [Hymenobacter sp. UV11]